MKRLELAGQRFVRLLVLECDLSRSGQGGSVVYWLCLCDCGKTVSVERRHLRSGRTQSCGCLSAEKARDRHLQHGRTDTPEYETWCHMKRRCFSPTDVRFPMYGGRGITVCPEWRNDFAAFFAHVGPRPSTRHSIDRIDNDGDYAPGNVRWATDSEQAANRRICIYVEAAGERITLSEYARRTGLSYPALRKAVRKGIDPLAYRPQRIRRR